MRLINFIAYLDFFPGDTLSDKIGVTELNDIYYTVLLIAGLRKPMCKALIVNIFHLRNLLTFLSECILLNIFMKVK